MVKLCKECKHTSDVHLCEHPRTVKKCPVTGINKYRLCFNERGNYIDSTCRPEGRLFEKKETQGSYGGEL